MFVPCFVVQCFVPFLYLIGDRELVTLCLSSWYLVTASVLWLFLTVPWVGLQCVIAVFPDHSHLLFGR